MIMRCQVLNEVNELMIVKVDDEEQKGDGSVIPRDSNGP